MAASFLAGVKLVWGILCVRRDPGVAKVNLSNIVVIPSQVNAHPFKTPYYSFYFNYILRYLMAYGYSRFRKSSTGSVSRVGRGFSRIPKIVTQKVTCYAKLKVIDRGFHPVLQLLPLQNDSKVNGYKMRCRSWRPRSWPGSN